MSDKYLNKHVGCAGEVPREVISPKTFYAILRPRNDIWEEAGRFDYELRRQTAEALSGPSSVLHYVVDNALARQ